MEHLKKQTTAVKYDKGQDLNLLLRLSFTGDAINHLSTLQREIDLNEWEWHEEVINGELRCIITDRLPVKQ